MNEETKIIGYHGTSKANECGIIQNGFEESKAKAENWLGKGVYFYENIYYAIEWGIIYFTLKNDKYEDYIEKCSVIQTLLDYAGFELLDLNDPVGYTYYLEIEKNIEERFPDKMKNIMQDGDIQIIRLIEEIEEETNEKLISNFDILIADYPKDIYKKGLTKIKGNFLPCIQKQICVKNSNIIKKINVIDLNNDEIKEYYKLIKENREGIKYEKQHKTIAKPIRKNKKYTR